MSVKSLVIAFALWTSPPPDHSVCLKPCVVSEPGAQIIRTFEGFSPFTYSDAAGFPTIGFGHLIRSGETFSEPLMGEAADLLLRKDLRNTENGVNQAVKRRLQQHQFDSLGSFTYNVGTGTLRKSTLLRLVNLSKDGDVPNQFRRYVYAGGKKLRGLVARREAEAMLYSAD